MKRLLSLVFIFCIAMLAGGCASTQVNVYPDISDQVWVENSQKTFYFTDVDETQILWRVSTYYRNLAGRYIKSEHVIFDELVLKGYVMYGKGGTLLQYWFEVEKNNIWYTGTIISFQENRNALGKVFSITITLMNKRGVMVVQREVMRK